MKVFSFLWQKLILPTCAIYTFITLLTEFFLTVLAEGTKKPALTLSACVMLFFLSLFICASALIFCIKKLPLHFRVLLNFAATLFSIIFITAFSSYEMDANSLVLIIVFTFVYIIVALPILLVKMHIDRKNSEEKTYTGMFEKKE